MSSSYNTPCIKHKLVVTIYSNTETSLAMSTLAIWCRIVQSCDVRSRVFSRPSSAIDMAAQSLRYSSSQSGYSIGPRPNFTSDMILLWNTLLQILYGLH